MMKHVGGWTAMAALVAPFFVLGAVRAADAVKSGEREVRESPSYIKERGGPAPNMKTSAHFTLRWGSENKGDAKIDEAYQAKAMEWLEQLWTLYIEQLKFPAGKHKYKVNAYITGTGLKPFLEGYAFGFGDPEGYGVLIGAPSIYNFGHNGSAHEFGHAMQAESGGFRDSDYVGWFWECHAQFLAHQATGKTDLPHTLDRYAETCQWDLNGTRHHYGSWIFLQYITERYPDGMARVNALWSEPRKYQDEDAIAKLRRMLPFTGNRDEAWADFIGDFAKRNVTWSYYKLGKEYRESMKFFERMDRRRFFTYLEPSPSRAGWYRVPRVYAPRQNSYNVVPLTPERGATSIKIELSGFIDPALSSAWRATIVAVDKDFKDRFSSTWAKGSGSLDIKPGEKLFLVVAATPLKHTPPKFSEYYPGLPYYPYEIKCTGAMPWNLGERMRPIPADAKGHAHPNGGGFVADSAKVAATAYVGKDAAVLDRAQVEGNARIEDFATVMDSAQVSGSAVVGGNALVMQNAKVQDEALVTDFAELHDNAVVRGRARVLAASRVFGGNEICDEAVLRGFATIRDVKKVSGCAIGDGEIEWDFSAPELVSGISFGTLLQRNDAKNPGESRNLYVWYPVNTNAAWQLRDMFGGSDGTLQCGAATAPDPVRGYAVTLSGKNQFVDVPRDLSLHRQWTLSAWVKLDSGRAGQCIASFGRDAQHALEVVAADETGKMAVRVRNGGAKLDIAGPKAPQGQWFNVAVTMGDTGTVFYVDGMQVGMKAGAMHPDDLRATKGFLGRGIDGGCLAGRIGGVSVFTRVLTAEEIQTVKEKGKL